MAASLKKKKIPRILVTVVPKSRNLHEVKEEGLRGTSNSMNRNIDYLTASLFSLGHKAK